MPKATRSVPKQRRHKKWIKRAKGYRGNRSKTFKRAKEAVLKAGQYAYRDRRKRKSNLRAHWQTQINAAVRGHDTTYSRFMHDLKTANIELDRKVLAQLAAEQPEVFEQVVAATKK